MGVQWYQRQNQVSSPTSAADLSCETEFKSRYLILMFSLCLSVFSLFRFNVNKRISIVGFGLYGSIHGPTDYQVNIQVT